MRLRTFFLAILFALEAVSTCSAASLLAIFSCQQDPIRVRTGVLKSKSGARAFIEATAKVIATRSDPEGELMHKCRTEWKLHVAAPGEQDFRQLTIHTYTEPEFTKLFGGDSSLYFGGGALEWSMDGDLLLVQTQIGGYEDWFRLTSIVYRVPDHRWWATDLSSVFERQERVSWNTCALFLRIAGFARDKRVLLQAEPFDWVEPRGCFPKSTWLLDPETGKLSRSSGASLPNNSQAGAADSNPENVIPR